MRVLVHALVGRWNAHLLEHLNGLRARAGRVQSGVQLERFTNLIAHGEHRVERGHGLLKNHRDAVAAHLAHAFFAGLDQVFALKQHLAAADAPRRAGNEPQQGQRGHAFAATRLAHHAQGFAAVNAQVDAIEHQRFTAPGIEFHP